jgi:hypothetical protein
VDDRAEQAGQKDSRAACCKGMPLRALRLSGLVRGVVAGKRVYVQVTLIVEEEWPYCTRSPKTYVGYQRMALTWTVDR